MPGVSGQVLGRGLEGRRPFVGGDEALGEDGIGRGALARGGQRHGALCVEAREPSLVELHLWQFLRRPRALTPPPGTRLSA